MSIVILYYIAIENNPQLSQRIYSMSFFWSFLKILLFSAVHIVILIL